MPAARRAPTKQRPRPGRRGPRLLRPAQAAVPMQASGPDVSGHASGTHLFYAVNSARWWAIYHDTGILYSAWSADLVTWTAGASLTLIRSLSFAGIGGTADGRALGVAYANIASTDVVHVGMTGPVSLTDKRLTHVRATISGTTLTWGTEAQFYNHTASGSTSPGSGVTIASDGKVYRGDTWLDDAGPPGTTIGDMLVIASSNADAGSSWTAGWPATGTLIAGVANRTTAHHLAPLASGSVLYVAPNGSTAGGLSNNLLWTRWNGSSWSASASLYGSAFASTVDDHDFALARRTTTDAHLVLRRAEAGNALNHWRYNGTSWTQQSDLPAQAVKAGAGGLALTSDGIDVWAFAIDSAAGNAVRVCKWSSAAGTWGSWSDHEATSATRNWVTAAPAAGGGLLAAGWTEGASAPYTFKTKPFTLPVTPAAVAETDTAQPITPAKARIVGQATSTETAQPVTLTAFQVMQTSLPDASGLGQHTRGWRDPATGRRWMVYPHAATATEIRSAYSDDNGATWAQGATLTGLAGQLRAGRNLAVSAGLLNGVLFVHMAYAVKVSDTDRRTYTVRGTVSGTTLTWGTPAQFAGTATVSSSTLDNAGIDITIGDGAVPVVLTTWADEAAGVAPTRLGTVVAGRASNADSGTAWTAGYTNIDWLWTPAAGQAITSVAVEAAEFSYAEVFMDTGTSSTSPTEVAGFWKSTADAFWYFLANTTDGTAGLTGAALSADWTSCRRVSDEIFLIKRSPTQTAGDYFIVRIMDDTGYTWGNGAEPPDLATKAGSGLVMVSDGTDITLYVIAAAAGNAVKKSVYSNAAGTWSAWSDVAAGSATRNSISGGTTMVSWTEGAASPYTIKTLDIYVPAGHTVIVGQASSSSTAQPVGRVKQHAVALASSAEIGQPVARVKVHPAGLAAETDSSQPVTRRKTAAVGQASTANTAQAITASLSGGAPGTLVPLGFSSASTGAGTGTSLACTVPAATISGAQMFAVLYFRAQETVTDPAGWVRMNPAGSDGSGQVDDSGMRSILYKRTATGTDETDATSYTWTWTTACKAVVVMGAYSNQHPSAPIRASAGTLEAGSSVSSHTTPSVTPAASDWLISVFGSTSSSAWSADAADTERVEVSSTGTGPVSAMLADSNAGVAAGAVTRTASQTGATSAGVFYLIAVQPAAAAAGHTVAVGQASSSSSAQPVGRVKIHAAAQASETDSSQPVRPARVRPVALASSTDIGQPVGRVKIHAAAQASETDSSQPVTRRKTRTTGQTAETSLAQPVTRRKIHALNQAAETSLAQPVARRKTRTPGQAAETSAAQLARPARIHATAIAAETSTSQPVTRRKTRTAGQALEASASQPVARRKAHAAAQASETDTGQPLTSRKIHPAGQAAETDAAQIVQTSGAKRRTPGQALETSTAQLARPARRYTPGQAAEVDTGRIVASVKQALTGRALETGQAQPVTVAYARRRTPGQVSTSDTALPVRPARAVPAGQASETSTAGPVGIPLIRLIGHAIEMDSARSMTGASPIVTIDTGQTAEADTARPVTRRKTRTIGQATVGSTAQPVARQKARHPGQAAELDTATAAVRRKRRETDHALELDTAGPVGHRKRHPAPQAAETDAARLVAHGKRHATGQASSPAGTAFPITRAKRHLVGQAEERGPNQALKIGRVKIRPSGQALETSQARPLIVPRVRLTGQALETSTATGIAHRKRHAVAQASERYAEQALPVTRAKRHPAGQALTADTAQTVRRAKLRTLGQPISPAVAQPLGKAKQHPAGQALDPASAGTVGRAKRHGSGQAPEASTARPLIVPRVRLVRAVLERDDPWRVRWQPRRLIRLALETDTAAVLELGDPIRPALLTVTAAPTAEVLLTATRIPADASATGPTVEISSGV